MNRPRIFVEVWLPIGSPEDDVNVSKKEIGITEWIQAINPGRIAELVINKTLKEVGYNDR